MIERAPCPHGGVYHSTQAPRRWSHLWRRLARGAFTGLGLLLTGPTMAADAISSARFTDPTTRYPHGVLGDRIEWGALAVTVTDGSEHIFTLPEHLVFEDIAPRTADVDGDGQPELIVVESHTQLGARLAIYGLEGRITATPHIGTRFRWLAPVGAADLDGNGQVEIAYIDRPHLAKTLRIWRFADGKLTEIATLPGLTNHRIGEDFISGGLRNCGTGPELVLASADWRRVISVRYNNDWQTQDLGPLTNHHSLIQAMDC